LASSRLLEYEVWNRLNAYGVLTSHGDRAQARLARVNLTALSEAALARALEPFPIAVRTLDALHLATMDFLRGRSASIELASYDNRLLAAAAALGFRAAGL
jgi:PIN domain